MFSYIVNIIIIINYYYWRREIAEMMDFRLQVLMSEAIDIFDILPPNALSLKQYKVIEE